MQLGKNYAINSASLYFDFFSIFNTVSSMNVYIILLSWKKNYTLLYVKRSEQVSFLIKCKGKEERRPCPFPDNLQEKFVKKRSFNVELFINLAKQFLYKSYGRICKKIPEQAEHKPIPEQTDHAEFL